MGFGGHAVPGFFFIVWGIWWMVCKWVRYYNSLRHGRRDYVNTVTHAPRSRCCPRVDIEAILLMVAGVVGIIVELPISSTLHHHPVTSGNGQHATMYFFFGLVGCFSLVIDNVKYLPVGNDLKYTCLYLAFSVEGLLFSFHLYGRDALDVLVHTLLVYTIAACALSSLAEFYFQHSLVIGLARSYFTLLQGSWFFQIAFTLYNPFGESWITATTDDHSQHQLLMLVTLIFTWHAAAALVGFLLVGVAIGFVYSQQGLLHERLLVACRHGDGDVNDGYKELGIMESADGPPFYE